MQTRHTLVLCLLAALACDRNAGPKPEEKVEPAASQPKAAALPPGHPSVPGEASHGQGALAGPEQAGGLTWHAQAPLVQQKPKSAMRAAQYGIEGDPAAELTVFYFGPGQGGAIEPNVARWLGQFTTADGKAAAKKAKRSKKEPAGIPVTLVETTGTYSAGMAMPGMPQAGPQTDWMLLGAIASGPQGPVFFKLVGPRATLTKARAGFMQLVDSIRPSAPEKTP